MDLINDDDRRGKPRSEGTVCVGVGVGLAIVRGLRKGRDGRGSKVISRHWTVTWPATSHLAGDHRYLAKEIFIFSLQKNRIRREFESIQYMRRTSSARGTSRTCISAWIVPSHTPIHRALSGFDRLSPRPQRPDRHRHQDSTGQITGGQFDDAAASGSERAACRSLPSARSPAVLTVAAHRAAGTSVTWRPGTAPLSPAVRTPILPACSACGRRDRDG